MEAKRWFCKLCEKGFDYESKYMRHMHCASHRRFASVYAVDSDSDQEAMDEQRDKPMDKPMDEPMDLESFYQVCLTMMIMIR